MEKNDLNMRQFIFLLLFLIINPCFAEEIVHEQIFEVPGEETFDDIKRNFQPYVILRGSNKTTARSTKISAAVNEKISFGNLEIYARACWKAPVDSKPENKVLLEIFEKKPHEETKRIFFGWMFSSSPSVSTLEHALYDINLLECAYQKP